jgi:hypothetical protein
MSLVYRLTLLGLAALFLLLGIQVPNFVDQYEKRLDAHYLEVQANLRPFQDIANQFHGGSLEALIDKHEQSADPTFKAEGEAIRSMQRRAQRFAAERRQLNVELPQQVLYLATRGDRELLDETRQRYSFALLLNREAVIAGLVLMAGVVILVELIAGLFGLLSRQRPVTH